MLVPAIVIITLALVFYTVGVWGERVQGTLKPWHAGMFALGLACDATGTWLMTQIAAERRGEGIQPGALSAWMAVSGTIAIILMAVHLMWAVVVLVRNREREKLTFHTFSLAVWVVWLASYIIGAASAMV
ncbi:MAG TPA: HsmA family protein [Micropruina sp.]|jgi:uncharacterized repeat protein (TIGR03987 family)|nr:HsmA family protein [Micropruina sp.]